jgi:hypothetical protein
MSPSYATNKTRNLIAFHTEWLTKHWDLKPGQDYSLLEKGRSGGRGKKNEKKKHTIFL